MIIRTVMEAPMAMRGPRCPVLLVGVASGRVVVSVVVLVGCA